MNINKEQVKLNIETELKLTKAIIRMDAGSSDIGYKTLLDNIYNELKTFRFYMYALKDLNLITEKEFKQYYGELEKYSNKCISNVRL